LPQGNKNRNLQAPTHRQAIATLSCNANSGFVQFSGIGRNGQAGFVAPKDEASQRDGSGLKAKLAAAGLSGVASYGIFNTLYYTIAFILVWYGVARVPKGQGIAVAAAAATKTLAIVWAGSQVTKLPRAGAALLAAPAVDKLLSFLKHTFRLKGKQQVFLYIIVPACWLTIACTMGGSILSGCNIILYI